MSSKEGSEPTDALSIAITSNIRMHIVEFYQAQHLTVEISPKKKPKFDADAALQLLSYRSNPAFVSIFNTILDVSQSTSLPQLVQRLLSLSPHYSQAACISHGKQYIPRDIPEDALTFDSILDDLEIAEGPQQTVAAAFTSAVIADLLLIITMFAKEDILVDAVDTIIDYAVNAPPMSGPKTPSVCLILEDQTTPQLAAVLGSLSFLAYGDVVTAISEACDSSRAATLAVYVQPHAEDDLVGESLVEHLNMLAAGLDKSAKNTQPHHRAGCLGLTGLVSAYKALATEESEAESVDQKLAAILPSLTSLAKDPEAYPEAAAAVAAMTLDASDDPGLFKRIAKALPKAKKPASMWYAARLALAPTHAVWMGAGLWLPGDMASTHIPGTLSDAVELTRPTALTSEKPHPHSGPLVAVLATVLSQAKDRTLSKVPIDQIMVDLIVDVAMIVSADPAVELTMVVARLLGSDGVALVAGARLARHILETEPVPSTFLVASPSSSEAVATHATASPSAPLPAFTFSGPTPSIADPNAVRSLLAAVAKTLSTASFGATVGGAASVSDPGPVLAFDEARDLVSEYNDMPAPPTDGSTAEVVEQPELLAVELVKSLHLLPLPCDSAPLLRAAQPTSSVITTASKAMTVPHADVWTEFIKSVRTITHDKTQPDETRSALVDSVTHQLLVATAPALVGVHAIISDWAMDTPVLTPLTVAAIHRMDAALLTVMTSVDPAARRVALGCSAAVDAVLGVAGSSGMFATLGTAALPELAAALVDDLTNVVPTLEIETDSCISITSLIESPDYTIQAAAALALSLPHDDSPTVAELVMYGLTKPTEFMAAPLLCIFASAATGCDGVTLPPAASLLDADTTPGPTWRSIFDRSVCDMWPTLITSTEEPTRSCAHVAVRLLGPSRLALDTALDLAGDPPAVSKGKKSSKKKPVSTPGPAILATVLQATSVSPLKPEDQEATALVQSCYAAVLSHILPLVSPTAPEPVFAALRLGFNTAFRFIKAGGMPRLDTAPLEPLLSTIAAIPPQPVVTKALCALLSLGISQDVIGPESVPTLSAVMNSSRVTAALMNSKAITSAILGQLDDVSADVVLALLTGVANAAPLVTDPALIAKILIRSSSPTEDVIAVAAVGAIISSLRKSTGYAEDSAPVLPPQAGPALVAGLLATVVFVSEQKKAVITKPVEFADGLFTALAAAKCSLAAATARYISPNASNLEKALTAFPTPDFPIEFGVLIDRMDIDSVAKAVATIGAKPSAVAVIKDDRDAMLAALAPIMSNRPSHLLSLGIAVLEGRLGPLHFLFTHILTHSDAKTAFLPALLHQLALVSPEPDVQDEYAAIDRTNPLSLDETMTGRVFVDLVLDTDPDIQTLWLPAVQTQLGTVVSEAEVSWSTVASLLPVIAACPHRESEPAVLHMLHRAIESEVAETIIESISDTVADLGDLVSPLPAMALAHHPALTVRTAAARALRSHRDKTWPSAPGLPAALLMDALGGSLPAVSAAQLAMMRVEQLTDVTQPANAAVSLALVVAALALDLECSVTSFAAPRGVVAVALADCCLALIDLLDACDASSTALEALEVQAEVIVAKPASPVTPLGNSAKSVAHVIGTVLSEAVASLVLEEKSTLVFESIKLALESSVETANRAGLIVLDALLAHLPAAHALVSTVLAKPDLFSLPEAGVVLYAAALSVEDEEVVECGPSHTIECVKSYLSDLPDLPKIVLPLSPAGGSDTESVTESECSPSMSSSEADLSAVEPTPAAVSDKPNLAEPDRTSDADSESEAEHDHDHETDKEEKPAEPSPAEPLPEPTRAAPPALTTAGPRTAPVLESPITSKSPVPADTVPVRHYPGAATGESVSVAATVVIHDDSIIDSDSDFDVEGVMAQAGVLCPTPTHAWGKAESEAPLPPLRAESVATQHSGRWSPDLFEDPVAVRSHTMPHQPSSASGRPSARDLLMGETVPYGPVRVDTPPTRPMTSLPRSHNFGLTRPRPLDQTRSPTASVKGPERSDSSYAIDTPPIPLRSILEHGEYRKFLDSFLASINQAGTTELQAALSFYVSVHEYTQMRNVARAAVRASVIVERFLAPNAWEPLPAGTEQAKQVYNDTVRQFHRNSEQPPVRLFQKAQDSAIAALRELYPAFVRSRHYSALIKSIRSR
ncbi:Regulator of G protein signaling domain [Carpediemonas membranifera]|uniref:Regulator of G protein signaling domain n=1 Tax=Carpediemonas membranifera TaxID=201153 RepID=A0A8J6EBC7_9EUKA|nr:Regulator of G protein signaling domain [Carpediemonas membranifera]|eukprot:KAG9396850.1 Regulator of G protein signaling domain [Carpediemonas membranifera]